MDGKERLGYEALFRSVNEQVQALEESFAARADRVLAVCECGTQSCIEQIPLNPPEYEHIRSNPLHFVIKPGHDVPETERPVEQNDRYWIVEKDAGVPERIARATDTR